jgi:NADPH-dependent glutamate synthase beta subunit-like oxidoreductase
MTDPRSRFEHRTPIPESSPLERTRDFGEIQRSYSKEEAIVEAQRCLQCALPYCIEACPITQDCRGYMALIAQERFDDAARLTIRDNPLASVLCKACYHYCEEDCIMGDRGVPIAIRHLKRAALEFGKSDLLYVPSAPRNQRIAVVGAGPAGLTAAWELGLRGYSVTVFEKEKVLGGQAEAIPAYRMVGYELQEDLARFRNLDVTFVEGKQVGVDFTPEELLREGYRAVCLTVGASQASSPGLPGENLPGVSYALDFLYEIQEGRTPPLGRRIVIVGGGDVAIDAVRSARRISPTSKIELVYRRKREEMTGSEEELAQAEPEDIGFRFQRSPVRVLGTNRVDGLVVEATEPGPPDESGRRKLKTVKNSAETIPCDTVILAVGEKADLRGFPRDLQLKLGAKGWPEGLHPDTMTAVEGVFATGGRSVVHAMAAGTRAAEAIDAYLSLKDGRAPTTRPDPFGGPERPKLPEGYSGPTWRP